MTREETIKSLRFFSPLNDTKIDWEKVDLTALVCLDNARAIAKTPIFVTSNYRTPEHSAEVGGFPTDEHTVIPVECFDISCARPDGKWNSRKAFALIPALIQAGFTRIGVNARNKSIHAGRNKSFPQDVLFIEL